MIGARCRSGAPLMMTLAVLASLLAAGNTSVVSPLAPRGKASSAALLKVPIPSHKLRGRTSLWNPTTATAKTIEPHHPVVTAALKNATATTHAAVTKSAEHKAPSAPVKHPAPRQRRGEFVRVRNASMPIHTAAAQHNSSNISDKEAYGRALQNAVLNLNAKEVTGRMLATVPGSDDDAPPSNADDMTAQVINLLKVFLKSKETEAKFDGQNDRQEFCEYARPAYEKMFKIVPEPEDSNPKYKNDAIKGLAFAIGEADKEIRFICEDYAPFHGRHLVVADHKETMKETEAEFVSAMTCQTGDLLCVGGQLEGARLDSCSCKCDAGWGNGDKKACELCTDIRWAALPWDQIREDWYTSDARTCTRQGKRTRTVDCNCGSPKPGVHFDKKRCDAHPNRLADKESCTYVPLKIASNLDGMCLANPGGYNVLADNCRGTDLRQGWYFAGDARGPSGQIRHEATGKCLAYDSSYHQNCWNEQQCRSGYPYVYWQHHCWRYWWWGWRWAGCLRVGWVHRTCWNVRRCSSSEGTNVEIHNCQRGDTAAANNQQWRREGTAFVAYNNNKCLAVVSKGDAGAARDRTGFGGHNRNAVMLNCNGQANQQWQMGAGVR